MDRWVGRIALVTGASAGIGAAICRELVKHGMIVIGCARNEQKIVDISNEQEVSKYPGMLHAMKCDMSDEKQILAMYEKIRSTFGRLDVCVNNAMSIVNSSLVTGETKDWRYMLEVGVLGLCINTREAIKLMKEGGVEDGQIIQMGSIVGHKIPSFQKPPENTPTPWFHMYNSIKTMIRALTEGLRQELKAENSRIRVATLSPGATETELLVRSLSPEAAGAFYGYYKCLQSKDVANAVVHILEALPYVNVHDIILEPIEFMIQA